MNNKYHIIYICLLSVIAILAAIMIMQLGSFSSAFNQHPIFNSLQHRINSIDSEMYSFQYSIESSLKQQASIISYQEIEHGEFNADSASMQVTVKIAAKEYNDSTTARLLIGNKEYNMQKNGPVFSVTTEVPVEKDLVAIVSFEQNGQIKSETLDEIIYCTNPLLKRISCHYDGRTSCWPQSQQLSLEGDIQIEFTALQSSSIKSARIYATVNGEELWQEDISSDISGAQNISYRWSLNKTFVLEPENELILYTEIEDSLGFVFCYAVWSAEINADGELWETQNMGTTQIYDKQGKLVATEEQWSGENWEYPVDSWY